MQGRQAVLVTLALLGNLAIGAQTLRAEAPDLFQDDYESSLQPPTPAPNQPPPPPSQIPAPPASGTPAQVPGQWVYTQQYGWIWMPYGDTYTREGPEGSPPNMYVYYPAGGWCWLAAPWVWGWGPWPFFGVLGPVRFGWWGHGFGHRFGPGFRGGHFRSFGRAGFGHPHMGGGFRGFRHR